MINVCVKKRICFITTSFANQGPVNVLYNILKYIDYSIFDVLLISLKEDKSESRFEDFSKLPINIVYLNNTNNFSFYKKFRKVKSTVKHFNPHAIHANDFQSVFFALLFKARYRIIATIHIMPGMQNRKIYGTLVGILLNMVSFYLYKRLDIAIACSDSLKNSLLLKKNSCIAVNNGVDFTPCEYEEKRQMRIKLGLDINKKIFVAVGRLSEEKNFKFLIDSFNKALSNDCLLIILGTGKLELLLKNMESEKVKLLGFRKDVNAYLYASDYFVSSSKVEGLPMAVLEAMATKLPVLLSDIEPHKQIVYSLPAQFGHIFKNSDFMSFQKEINNLLLTDYDELSKNSYMCYCFNYSAKKMSEKYQSIFASVTKK